VVELQPTRHGDERGWFSEVWNRSTLESHGISIDWVQDNTSMSAVVGTVRGIHYQLPDHAQTKLVRVVAGAVLDVAVDLRKSSPSFGQWVAVRLDAAIGNQLLVPEGFGHGFCTLEPNTLVSYKVSDYYDPACDRSVQWDDPDIAIDWPAVADPAALSTKDAAAPALAQAEVFA
jgi:dTDP-4-dehydrorhamnose 3,5-epimerase